MIDSTLKILVVEPMQPCRVQEIPDTLDAMQQIVGGHIESCSFQGVAVISNEEGIIHDLPYNRPLLDAGGMPLDIIQGTFFITGVSGERFVSLTDEQIQRYKDLYDNVMIITAEKDPMPNYDLSTVAAISAAAEQARTRANQEPSQDSYNAAWLHGYAQALSETAEQLEPRSQSHKKQRRKTSHER